MPPNNALIRDYSTFGDLTQKDVYLRHKNQAIKEGSVENYFIHINGSNEATNAAIEKVSYDGTLSKYEVYTKPSTGDVNYAAEGSMLEITTDKTFVRSLEFEAAGNVSFGNLEVTGSGTFGGTLGVTGDTTLSAELLVSGNASITQNLTVSGDSAVTGNSEVTGTLGVTGDTTLSAELLVSGNASITQNLTVSGDSAVTGNSEVTGTLGVTGDTTLSAELLVSGNASVTQNLTVSGDSAVTGNAEITGTLGVTGDTTLSAELLVSGNASITQNLTVSGDTAITGNAEITGTLGVTGDTTLSAELLVSGNASVTQNLTVSGDSAVSGNSSVTGNLSVTGHTTLQDLTVNGLTTSIGNVSMSSDLIVSGNAVVSGNLTVSGLTTLDDLQLNGFLASGGNVYLTGNTTISSLILEGQSGFSGNIDMGDNYILNVNAVEQDNVRVLMDGSAKTIDLQTRADLSSPWESEVLVSTTGMSVTNDVTMSGDVTMDGPSTATVSIPNANVSITGPEVTFGTVSSTTNITLFGNLEVMGTATNTRIESNIVQIGDKNVELGFLEKDTLANLDGAGLTVGGPDGAIPLRPNLVYASTDNAWQPNIDIITKGTETARMNTAGYFVSSLTSDAGVFTKVDSNSITFSDKWRFKYDSGNVAVNLEYYDGSAWIPKFTYTA